ncbi:hypothetical protein D3C79_884560 [compost metagenome]
MRSGSRASTASGLGCPSPKVVIPSNSLAIAASPSPTRVEIPTGFIPRASRSPIKYKTTTRCGLKGTSTSPLSVCTILVCDVSLVSAFDVVCVCVSDGLVVAPLLTGAVDEHPDNNNIKLMAAANIISLFLIFPNINNSSFPLDLTNLSSTLSL